MTDREKLIELMNENFTEYCNVDIVAGHCKIRAITFDVDRFADFLISNGVTVQKWIPVSERLPEHDGTYLVITKTGCVTTARWYAESDIKNYRGEFIRHVEGRFHRNATHWMPLPEPPKEENG